MLQLHPESFGGRAQKAGDAALSECSCGREMEVLVPRAGYETRESAGMEVIRIRVGRYRMTFFQSLTRAGPRHQFPSANPEAQPNYLGARRTAGPGPIRTRLSVRHVNSILSSRASGK